MKDNYTILLEKLDRFIRKYYLNQLIKGAILCLSLWLLFFLTVNTIEYFARLDVLFRTILFYLFVASGMYVFYRFIAVSLLKLYRLGKQISHEEASRIIGEHFLDVSDRLLNTLQLKQLEKSGTDSLALLQASIDQKAETLRFIPFTSAIDYKKNIRYTRFLAPLLLVLTLLLLTSPTFITEPANRLIRHNEYFEKPLPFSLAIVNDKLEGIQYDDFRLEVEIQGSEMPDRVMLETEGNLLRFRKRDIAGFYYDFLNLQQDVEFFINAGKVRTGPHRLKVIPKPVILDFEIALQYPAYTGKTNEMIRNNGDMIVPEGTEVIWKFITSNTRRISMRFDTLVAMLEQKDAANSFTYSRKFRKTTLYSVTSGNDLLAATDSLLYQVTVIPDLFPTIVVDEFRDSLLATGLFFKGMIGDDYGFNKLLFRYTVKSENDIERHYASERLPLREGLNPQQFYHYTDLAALQLRPGDVAEYFFEVWDNDAINGSKSTRTPAMVFKVPTVEEIEKLTEDAGDNIRESMQEGIKEAAELQKQAAELQKKLFDKNDLSWEDKQQIQSLLDKQTDLKARMEDIRKENELKSLRESQYKEINPDLLEKQKQLEELMKELLEDEELQKLFEELQKLMDEVSKDKLNEMLEKMKMTSEEMEDILDRNLELFKQFEFEKKLDETIDKLNELTRQQENLAEQSEDKNTDAEAIKQEQDKLNEAFNDLQKDLEKLDEMNKNLESPNTFDQMEEMQNEISQEMMESLEMLEKGSKGKASKSQKGAAGKMEEMSQSLQQMQEDMLEEGMMEDIDALRGLLDNLIKISFDQEDLIERTRSVNVNDPGFSEITKDQKRLKDNMQMIEDSLMALARRNIMIEPFITRETGEINRNMGMTLDYLHNRKTTNAATRQQFIMTSVNNLALMLSESLQQMQMSLQSMQQGGKACKSKCNKPGSGQSSMKSIRQLQQQLGEQIEQLKKGQKPGGKTEGGNQGNEKQNMSEQLARLAAEQEAIRSQLRQVAGQLEKDGQFQESRELKSLMEEMEKTETDLVNKMISQETLMRQQNILTRLLKSEKAELEREQEEKRESKEAENIFRSNPEEFFEYKRILSNEVELLKTVPPKLNPFYREKVNRYFYYFEE